MTTTYAIWQEYGPIYATGSTPDEARASARAIGEWYPRGDDGRIIEPDIPDGRPTDHRGLAVAPMTARLAEYVERYGTPDRYRMTDDGTLDLIDEEDPS